MGNATTILVIDDEFNIRQFLRAALEFEGFVVREARDAEEGIRSATLKPPDLIVLDLGLPDRDGSSIIERLRLWSNIPIIVLACARVSVRKFACSNLARMTMSSNRSE